MDQNLLMCFMDMENNTMKKISISKEEAAEFYKVHQSKPFYNDLCNYLSSGPIVVMILEGKDAISKNRKISSRQVEKKCKPVTKKYLKNWIFK